MDSEFLSFVVCVLLATIVIATLIQWPGGSTSMLVSLFFCLFIAVVGGFILGTIHQWGQSASGSMYFLWMIAVFVLSFVPAYVLRHILLPEFLQVGLFKWPVVLGVFISVFLIYRYAAFYRQYEWQLIQLNHGDIQRLSGEYFADLTSKSPYASAASQQNFTRRFDLYHPNRLRPNKYPGLAEDNIFTLLGLPSSFYAVYYVPTSGKLYRAELELPRRDIERLSAWRWLYPLYPYQKYHFLELLLSESGRVAIYVANSQESKLVALVEAQEIDVSTLTRSEAERFGDKGQEQGEKQLILTPHELFSAQFSVAHQITGSVENVAELRAISYNGERYTLTKKYWAGQPLPGQLLPLACLRYLTYNAEGKLLEWVYQYPFEGLHEKLQNPEVTDSEPVSLLYSYFLRFNENKKLQASSYEYINGEKSELEVSATIYSVDPPEAR